MFAFRTPKWQDWNEIDIELEANIKNKVAWNIINAFDRQGYPADKAAPDTTPVMANFTIQAAHTYAFEWTPTNIVFTLDGATIKTFTPTGAVPIPNKSAKIMMNLWVFGNADAFGNPANNKYPFHTDYDYFRFYKWNNETTYPLANPKALPADDTDFSKHNSGETVYP